MSKRKKEKAASKVKDRVSIKYVKRANCWCKTTFTSGQQAQTWSTTRPQL